MLKALQVTAPMKQLGAAAVACRLLIMVFQRLQVLQSGWLSSSGSCPSDTFISVKIVIFFCSTYLAAYLCRRTRWELYRDDDMRNESHCVGSSRGGSVPGCHILNHIGVAAGVSQAPLEA